MDVIAVDIGNTEIKCGVFQGRRLVRVDRESTALLTRPRELSRWLARLSRRRPPSHTIAVASVVPEIQGCLVRALRRAGRRVVVVDPGTRTDMPVHYRPRGQLGADRFVNAYAARARYGAPVVVVSFGTAVTIDVVSADGAYRGGVILPGMPLMAKALAEGTAQLPLARVTTRPGKVIGQTTRECLQSGLYYGMAGAVAAVLERVLPRACRGHRKMVVATGGSAASLAPLIRRISRVDPHLTLHGLYLFAEQCGDEVV